MTAAARAFVDAARHGHLATADAAGRPHVVPICFARTGETLHIVLDSKPKRVDARALKRVRNIAENPEVALVVDRWDEDWNKLAWVMARGPAELLAPGKEQARAVAALRARYPQYRAMDLDEAPVIAARVARWTWWGAV